MSKQNTINILIELGVLMNLPHLFLRQNKVNSFTWTNIMALLNIIKLNKSMVISRKKNSLSLSLFKGVFKNFN